MLFDGDLVDPLFVVEGEFIAGDGAVVAKWIPDFLKSNTAEFYIVAFVLLAVCSYLLGFFCVELSWC